MARTLPENSGDFEILKEIHSVENIEVKTELQDPHIEAIGKLKTMHTITGNPLLNEHLNMFMMLRKSRERKGMLEFVKSLISRREDLVNMNEKKESKVKKWLTG